MFKIPYGVSNFEKIRRDHLLYIDKTHFIKEVEKSYHLIHLRPRRFGKSLFLSMLDCYYDVNSAHKFDELFNGLYIHNNPTVNKNSYYMLRFNFSGVQNTAKHSLEDGFLARVQDGVERFINRYGFNIKVLESQSPASVLAALFKDFEKLALKNKIYILIDEYDHFTNSILSGDGQEFLKVLKRGGFVRSFYEIIKEKAELGLIERLFITGVMSVTLDSMTSGFNIATNITTESRFSDVMGFTTDEVKEMLKLGFTSGDENDQISFTVDEQIQTFAVFRQNYNGYLFSKDNDVKIFNSTLIMYYLNHYVNEKKIPESLIDVNLNQSGTTIENIVGLKNREANYKYIEEIVHTKEIEGTLQPFIDIDKKFDKNDVITLLFNIGLLTIKGFDMITKFEVPNKMIENIYLGYLSELVQQQSDYQLDLSKQQQAIVEMGRRGEINALTALVSEFLMNTHPRNTIKFDEKYIKLAYMMLLVYSNQFVVYDEFQALNGFIDLLIQKSPNSTARYELLIELKYIKKSETTDARIEFELADGRRQINRYIEDDRLSNTPWLKKFIIVFSGFEAVRIEEVKVSI